MKNLKTKTWRTAAAFIIVLFAFSAASLFAGGDKTTSPPPPSTLIISFDENFTGSCEPGENCIDGTTTLAGAFSDKGTRHQDNTVVGASKDGKKVFVTGTVTITGANGVLTTEYTGTIVFDGTTNIAYITGTESITGGTGIYADASGKGMFEATIDFDTGNIVGAASFHVNHG
jgi:hypothetical protein